MSATQTMTRTTGARRQTASMAPKVYGDVVETTEADELLPDPALVAPPDAREEKLPPRCREIVWRNVFLFAVLHSSALAGLYTAFYCCKATLVWALLYSLFAALGVTAGAHRLWAHRTYQARLPLRIFLAVCNTAAFQNHLYEWCRDHRVHHKFSETHADPHNVNRGFFFAHMGWLLVRKHPDVISQGRKLDLSDLLADPVVVVQRKFYLPGVLLLCFTLPSAVPHLLWGESLLRAFLTAAMFRYCLLLHLTWCVNSVAHLFGTRPYDRSINPAENILVSLGAVGEGFHNYHHTFPHDYSTSEFGWRWNISTAFIDLMALLGQAHGRRKVSPAVVRARRLRTGEWPGPD